MIQTLKLTLTVDSMDAYMSLFGLNDQNVALIEQECSVSVSLRGAELSVTGEEADVALAVSVIDKLLDMIRRGDLVDRSRIRYAIALAREGKVDMIDEILRSVVAITHRGKHLLVAAAAGSGKTAVLVERVIRRITDPVSPVDVDRILVVTFTRAAAAEMRSRISDSLRELICLDPANLALQRQLMLLQQAQICTIDAFFSGFVRENFERLGVSQNQRKAMEAGSMCGWDSPGADPANYEDGVFAPSHSEEMTMGGM